MIEFYFDRRHLGHRVLGRTKKTQLNDCKAKKTNEKHRKIFVNSSFKKVFVIEILMQHITDNTEVRLVDPC